MNKYFYNLDKIEDYHQVIYPQCSKELDYISGYKKAIEELFKCFKKNKRGYFHDDLLFPLLFLIQHLLELTLKHIIQVIWQHKKDGCPWLTTIEIHEKKLKDHLGRHSLGDLIDDLKNILDKIEINNLHFFQGFIKINQLVSNLINFNVDSFSTRYNASKEGKPYFLTEKQIGVDIFPLHKNVISAVEDIINYTQSTNFVICSQNLFSIDFISQLERVKNALVNYSLSLSTYKFETFLNRAPEEENNECFTLGSLDSDSYFRDRKQLEKFLGNYNNSEKTLIVYGLYFGTCNLADIGSIDNFSKWSEQQKNIKILQKTPINLTFAISQISEYLAYLNEHLTIKVI